MAMIIIRLLHSFDQVLVLVVRFGAIEGCICNCDFIPFLFLFRLLSCDSAQCFEEELHGLLLVLKFVFIFLVLLR